MKKIKSVIEFKTAMQYAGLKLNVLRCVLAIVLLSVGLSTPVAAGELVIGAATADITPTLPVTLVGQMFARVARTAATPLYAGVVAIETRNGTVSEDQVVFVSCDMVAVPLELIRSVRAAVGKQLPGFDTKKIILNATHTHTAATFDDGDDIPPGVSTPAQYRKLFTDRVSAAIVKAWKTRAKGSMSWSLTTAVVAHNRRAVYTDSSAVMYGKTDKPEFQNFEGYADPSVNTLFFWDSSGKLIAASVDVPCPSQEVELDTLVNADYWHETRLGLKKALGADLTVVAWTGAAGDQSPHLMYLQEANKRMLRLTGQTRKEAIAKRIVNAVVEGYEAVKADKYTNIRLKHVTETLALPMREVTEPEYIRSKKLVDEANARLKQNPGLAGREAVGIRWNGRIVDRYEKQKSSGLPTYSNEIHVLRIGDIAVCTNEFEFFTDFGLRIQARSKALQTFIVQLAGPGTYLPTAKAVTGGGYSAEVMSNSVGPQGGQILVDRTVQLIDTMWESDK